MDRLLGKRRTPSSTAPLSYSAQQFAASRADDVSAWSTFDAFSAPIAAPPAAASEDQPTSQSPSVQQQQVDSSSLRNTTEAPTVPPTSMEKAPRSNRAVSLDSKPSSSPEATKALSREIMSERQEESISVPRPSDPPTAVNDNLYVQYLPATVTNAELHRLFANVGVAKSVRLVTDVATGRSKGYGFVLMATPELAQLAVKRFNGLSYMGKKLLVRLADHSPTKPHHHRDASCSKSKTTPPRSNSRARSKSCTRNSKTHAGTAPQPVLYVTGLPLSWRETETSRYFENVSGCKVKSVRIMFEPLPEGSSPELALSKGIGLVRFTSADDATVALDKTAGKSPGSDWPAPLVVRFASRKADDKGTRKPNAKSRVHAKPQDVPEGLPKQQYPPSPGQRTSSPTNSSLCDSMGSSRDLGYLGSTHHSLDSSSLRRPVVRRQYDTKSSSHLQVFHPGARQPGNQSAPLSPSNQDYGQPPLLAPGAVTVHSHSHHHGHPHFPRSATSGDHLSGGSYYSDPSTPIMGQSPHQPPRHQQYQTTSIQQQFLQQQHVHQQQMARQASGVHDPYGHLSQAGLKPVIPDRELDMYDIDAFSSFPSNPYPGYNLGRPGTPVEYGSAANTQMMHLDTRLPGGNHRHTGGSPQGRRILPPPPSAIGPLMRRQSRPNENEITVHTHFRGHGPSGHVVMPPAGGANAPSYGTPARGGQSSASSESSSSRPSRNMNSSSRSQAGSGVMLTPTHNPYAQAKVAHSCRYCRDGTSVMLGALPYDRQRCVNAVQEVIGGFGDICEINCLGDGRAIATFVCHSDALSAVQLMGASVHRVVLFDCRGMDACEELGDGSYRTW